MLTPLPTDILSGRGRTNMNHPGNKYFVQTVRSRVEEYLQATKRIEKTAVVGTMLADLYEEGVRFLRFVRSTQSWEIMTPEQAHEKASHAIRDQIKYNRKGGEQSAPRKALAKKRSFLQRKRQASVVFCCLEPINVHSNSFCHQAFDSAVERTLSRQTSDILQDVLQVQRELEEISMSPNSVGTLDEDMLFDATLLSARASPCSPIHRISIAEEEVFTNSDCHFLLAQPELYSFDGLSFSF